MRVLLFANTDWYLYNFRLGLAEALREAGHEVILMSPSGEFHKRLEARGFRWVEVPLNRRSLNPFSELRLIWWVRNFIRQERIELVHGFTIKCVVYGALAAKLAGDVPRVCAVAGLGYVFSSEELKARVLRPIVRTVMRLALKGERTRVIVQSRGDLELLAEMGLVKPGALRLVRGSGVDCQRFSGATPRGEGEPLRVLMASRLLWEKGVAEYVEAARRIRRRGTTSTFLLAGEPDPGNPNSIPIETVREWAREGAVEWLGHVEDMPSLLASVHVLTLPTAYGEGVPRSILEASACGLAVVASDASGCREVVTDGVTGLLVPMGDAGSLARALARLEDEPELVSRLGSAAQALVRREFEEHLVIEQTAAVYRELLPELSQPAR